MYRPIDPIRPDFPDTGVCGRFHVLSGQYGFILRYPAGREQMTGIAHEPWHFRYIGYPHSLTIARQAMTLEDYIDYLKKFPFGGRHLVQSFGGRTFEIFRVPVAPGGEAEAVVADTTPFQVSGDNAGGIVVTLWRDGI
jgi:D-alanyl-D-alanine dipeptidase/carboxypeptidase